MKNKRTDLLIAIDNNFVKTFIEIGEKKSWSEVIQEKNIDDFFEKITPNKLKRNFEDIESPEIIQFKKYKQ